MKSKVMKALVHCISFILVSIMEIISCICKGCDIIIGDFTNLWTQIGTSYYSPIVDAESDLGIESHGGVRWGEQGTLVEGCQLQDVRCVNCATVLGIKCLSTPVNHVLDQRQILFKLSTIQPMCKDDGHAVELVVRRYLKLRHNHRTGTDNPGQGTPDTSGSYGRPKTSDSQYASSTTACAADLSQLHAEIEAQRGDIDRIDSEGYKVVTALNGAVTSVEAGLNRMEAALGDLRREIGGSQEDTASLKSEIKHVKKQSQAKAEEACTTIDRLKDQLKSAITSVEGLRRDLGELTAKFDMELATLKAGLRQNTKDIAELKSFTLSARDHAEDMAGVRGEMAQLRKEMDYNKRARLAGPFPSREFDILTSNISKIGNRANQVEGLQMEFEILKGRVERIEAAAQAQPSSQAHQATGPTAMGISIYDRYEGHDIRLEERRPFQRNRTSLEQESLSPITRQKRIAASPDVTDSLGSPLQRQTESRAEKDTRVEPTKRTGRPPKRKSVGG